MPYIKQNFLHYESLKIIETEVPALEVLVLTMATLRHFCLGYGWQYNSELKFEAVVF